MSKSQSKSDKKRSIIPIEEWAKDIAQRKPRRHAIQEILPAKKGEYIAIAGRTGIGKTNLALHLAFCLATGTPFFGLECRRFKVAYIALEGSETDIKARYDKIIKYFPSTKGKLLFGMVPLSNPKEILNKVFNETEGCSILILDPVKFLVPGDYLKPHDAAIFVREFKKNLASQNKAAIISLPIRKPNEQSLIQPGDVYQMKGATEYADSAISILLLEKKRYSKSKDRVVLT